MYTVNSLPLDNPTFGWRLMRRTQLITQITKKLTSIDIPSKPGVLSGVPAFRGPSTSVIVVRCAGAVVEPLYTLFTQNGGVGYIQLTDDPSRRALFELASIDSQGLTAFDDLVDVTITIRLPRAQWEDTALTTVGPVSVTTAVQTVEGFQGMTSEISAPDVFIDGDFANFTLTDFGSSSWLKTVKTFPNVAGTGLLYVGSTGQAFRANTTSPWDPTADMTDYIDVSGGGGFRLAPTLENADPTATLVSLDLVTTAQSGVTIRVRGYKAYHMRNGSI